MLTTIMQRRNNKVLSLKGSAGNWISDESSIKQHIQTFFFKLFTPDFVEINLLMEPFLSPPPQLPISDKLLSLSNASTIQEIKRACIDFKPFKAFGLDDRHACFYQNFWNLIENSGVQFVRNSFDHKPFPRGINDSLICLIPKTDRPQSI